MAKRLDERIPEQGFANTGEMLDAFLEWVADRGLELYPHQEEAILEVFEGRHVVLDAPTGSGKSLVATAMHFKTFAEVGKAFYTAPIKALVSEKFFDLCTIFGAEFVGLITGDGAVNRDAPIICCTAEILANLALREGTSAKVTSVVMDEFHYYSDRDRGVAWQIPLLLLPNTQFMLMSATLGDTTAIREDLQKRTGRTVSEVKGVHRPVPLEFSYSMHTVHEQLGMLVRAGKAPIYVVHFTQREATEQAQALMSTDYCTKEEKKAIADAIRGFGFRSPFGPTIRRYVMHGVGLHHAGLLPRYRLLVERLAQQGLLKIICGTDTLGVGVNVPIRTVLFTQLCKFDGEKVVILRVRDFKQIAGRAGRAGFDTVGYVVVQAPAHVIENANADRPDPNNPKKKKKVVKAQPPTKGYKHWDEVIFRQLVERPPEPLEGVFAVDHGRLLMLMQHAEETTSDATGGYTALLDLIGKSHTSERRKEELRKDAAGLLAQLQLATVVRSDPAAEPAEPVGASVRSPEEPVGSGVPPAHLRLDPNLQHDFSLHHSLSLFLLDALATLDRSSPTYAYDVVTWVEAILENPRAVLMAQVSREKGNKIAELKAAGVPYEDRIDALDEITWPKPHGEAIYAFFNEYAKHHPWVAREAIRPKSVVREMAETLASFPEYVNGLLLQRSEGVLLRYLTDAYKALIQNVPAELRTDELDDVIAWLHALLARVDSSLLTEWETLLAGTDLVEEAKKLDISASPKQFAARIRAEAHAMVRAFAARDWDEAAACVRREDDSEWPPEAFEAALAPYFEEFGEVGFDGPARASKRTIITAEGPHQWRVRQLFGPPSRGRTETWSVEGYEEEEESSTWAISARIDLRDDTNPTGLLLREVTIEPG